MNITVIECNDYQLTVTQRDANGDERSISQPGFAYVTHSEVVFGESARLQAQLNPGSVYSHYWQRLGYQDIVSDNEQVRHFADLVYLQLQHLLSLIEPCEDVVLVVAPSFNAPQLSLLLGIMHSCQLNVLAMVNSAVLAMSSSERVGQQVWLDIGLHHSEYSQLVSSDQLTFERVDTYSEQGFYSLSVHLARWLNQLFIRQCRFDASLEAASEQRIYQQVASILSQSASSYDVNVGEREITIKQRQLNQQIDIFFNDIIAAVQRFYQQSGRKVAISERFFTLLSGSSCAAMLAPVPCALTYAQVLNQLDHLTKQSAPSKELSSKGTSSKETSSKEPSSNLIIELPVANATSITDGQAISHIVCNGHAYPLTEQPLFLSDVDEAQFSSSSDQRSVAVIKKTGLQWYLSCLKPGKASLARGQMSQGRALVCGDEITLDGSNIRFMLIKLHQEL